MLKQNMLILAVLLFCSNALADGCGTSLAVVCPTEGGAANGSMRGDANSLPPPSENPEGFNSGDKSTYGGGIVGGPHLFPAERVTEKAFGWDNSGPEPTPTALDYHWTNYGRDPGYKIGLPPPPPIPSEGNPDANSPFHWRTEGGANPSVEK